jgi:hypothetical protein
MINHQCDFTERSIIEKLSIIAGIDYKNPDTIEIKEPVYEMLNSREEVDEFISDLKITGSNISKLYKLIDLITYFKEQNDKIEITLGENAEADKKIIDSIPNDVRDLSVFIFKRKYRHNEQLYQLCELLQHKQMLRKMKDRYIKKYIL